MGRRFAEGEEVVNNNDEAEEEQSDATRDAALAQAAGKNFADTEILSTGSIGIGYSTITTKIYDIFDEKRVDTINNFDSTRDINTYDSKSKYLTVKNKRFSCM